MASVAMKIHGLEDMVRRLNDIDPKLRRKTLKKAVDVGSKILLMEMKIGAPRGDTGMLRRSLGVRIQVYRNSGLVVAIVGPRTGYKRVRVPKGEAKPIAPGSRRARSKGTVKVLTALGERYLALGVNATRYAHLVEFGSGPRVSLRTGKNSGQMPARPFMRPALDRSRGMIFDAMREVFTAGLAEAASGK